MNIRPIAIYPISFIKNDMVRRILLVLLLPFIVAGNALWFILPVAPQVKAPIFRDGFWNAVWSAIVSTWRRGGVSTTMLPYSGYSEPEPCPCDCNEEDEVFRVDD